MEIEVYCRTSGDVPVHFHCLDDFSQVAVLGKRFDKPTDSSSMADHPKPCFTAVRFHSFRIGGIFRHSPLLGGGRVAFAELLIAGTKEKSGFYTRLGSTVAQQHLDTDLRLCIGPDSTV